MKGSLQIRTRYGKWAGSTATSHTASISSRSASDDRGLQTHIACPVRIMWIIPTPLRITHGPWIESRARSGSASALSPGCNHNFDSLVGLFQETAHAEVCLMDVRRLCSHLVTSPVISAQALSINVSSLGENGLKI
jgi:hypothetical protein